MVDPIMSSGQPMTGSSKVPFVSVIVPVYNDARRLGLCMNALLDQDYPAGRLEVIVVDNNSDDDPMVAMPDDPRFRLLHESRRGSYAARNAGVGSARGDVLAFTDSDCIPHRDWLSRGVAALSREPLPEAVGGAIKIFFHHGSTPHSAPEHFEAINEFQQRKYVQEWSFAATANLFVNAAVVARLGGFNSSLQSGGDLDFGKRLTGSGGRLIYDDDTQVDHPARSSWRELGRKTIRVANGIADRHDRTRKASLSRAWHEGRGGITIWVRVWNGTRPAPKGVAARILYASAFTYVRALRTLVHLRRLAGHQLTAK